MRAAQLCLLLLSLLLATAVSTATAQQNCPGIGPWHLKCPQYCCLQDFDEPLEGQYCCSSCRYSYDAAVRNAYNCTASHYLHQTWAVVLMACGIAFIALVFCTCCCCCCCAPCKARRRRRGPYVCCESGKQDFQHQYQHRYYGSGAAPSSVGASQQHLSPSAPPAPSVLATSASSNGRVQRGKGNEAAAVPQPPPYQPGVAGGSEQQQQQQLPPPPTYRP